ncbi:hypothetical protein SNE40_001205 [Patella caerulea]|uniref:F-box domain-containing protein n=1 Tax=Patella caerulea TaxID=87958 RepID=A0AAN8Q391_PATCE
MLGRKTVTNNHYVCFMIDFKKRKRKTEKGILGVPKRPMLFSFNVRQGEEWSSDSEDSDYLPSDEEISNTKRKVNKRKRIKNCQEQKPKESVEKLTERSGVSLQLPEEILLKIFQESVNSQGTLPFLVRASKVCRTWRNVACDPTLWRKVDLSFGWIKMSERVLKWLCENRLTHCTDVNLSASKFFVNSNIKLLTETCSQLKVINISYCKVTTETIVTIAENCHQLASLDLSFTPVDAVCLQSLKVLLPKHGPYLKQLTMGGNTYKSFNSVFNLILSHCPQLEMLDISNCLFSTDIVLVNVKKFQNSCPNLQILGLANSRIGVSQEPGLSSFPKLEQLSVAYNKPGDQPRSCLNLDLVTRILHDSPDLKLLDLRGNDNIDCYNLCNIDSNNLQSLHASNTATQRDGSQYQQLALLLTKWRRSLVELDLSWSTLREEDLKHAFKRLVNMTDHCPLSSLNLAGTNVTQETLSLILNKCQDLTSVNLTSCRGMTRGFKREFLTATDVRKLRKELNSMNSSDSSN